MPGQSFTVDSMHDTVINFKYYVTAYFTRKLLLENLN